MPRDMSSQQQHLAVTNKERMVRERGLIVRPYSRRTGHEQRERDWRSQRTIAEGGRCTEDWIGTVAIDRTLKGAPRRHSAFYWVWIEQLCFDHAGEQRMDNVAQYHHNENFKDRGEVHLGRRPKCG